MDLGNSAISWNLAPVSGTTRNLSEIISENEQKEVRANLKKGLNDLADDIHRNGIMPPVAGVAGSTATALMWLFGSIAGAEFVLHYIYNPFSDEKPAAGYELPQACANKAGGDLFACAVEAACKKAPKEVADARVAELKKANPDSESIEKFPPAICQIGMISKEDLPEPLNINVTTSICKIKSKKGESVKTMNIESSPTPYSIPSLLEGETVLGIHSSIPGLIVSVAANGKSIEVSFENIKDTKKKLAIRSELIASPNLILTLCTSSRRLNVLIKFVSSEKEVKKCGGGGGGGGGGGVLLSPPVDTGAPAGF